MGPLRVQPLPQVVRETALDGGRSGRPGGQARAVARRVDTDVRRSGADRGGPLDPQSALMQSGFHTTGFVRSRGIYARGREIVMSLRNASVLVAVLVVAGCGT